MKVVVFAGGVGTRLWPLSRKNTPKQFEKIIGEKSTLQLTVERLLPSFQPPNIYIATSKRYADIVGLQLPTIPKENLILEPEVRDIGPAVGLATALLGREDPNSPFAIVWSDHLLKKERRFREVLDLAKQLIENKETSMVLIGQRARFANQNIGWIEFGDQIKEVGGTKIFQFKRIVYRPTLEEAEVFLKSGRFAWNPGYFVTTPSFLFSQFQTFTPNLYEGLMKIQEAYGSPDFQRVLDIVYPTLEKVSFDNAILERIHPASVCVIAADLGWSDVGAWEALKEALEISSNENVTRGKVLINDSSDNLVFNYTDQLTVGIDLQNLIIINTDDVLLVCHKNSIPKIKKLVESLVGTSHEHLT